MPKERVRLASTKPCRTSPGSEVYGRPSSQVHSVVTVDGDVDTSSMTSSMSSPSSSDVTSGDGALSAAESAQTNLIVNYLPQTMSQEDMKSLFASVGDMESCRLIRDKSTGQSLGYGFVKYKNVETANRAIALLNGLRLQNKTIKVSVARPSSDCIKGANLYVGGLPKHVTNQDLMNWFSPSGQIVTARVLCDPQSGLTRGVGFVRFNLKSEAETAIRLLSGTIPPGTTEPITVKFANQPTVAKTTVVTAPKPVPVSATQAATALLLGNSQLPSASAMLAHQNAPLGIRYSAMPPVDPLLMTSFPVTNASSPQCGATVTVTNLPAEADENIVYRLFASFGGVQSVYPLPGQRAALVTMFNYVDALNAVSGLNGLTLNGCTIQVTTASSGTPGCPNPCQLTVLPLGHGFAMDSGRMMPYFIPSMGVPSGVHDMAASIAII